MGAPAPSKRYRFGLFEADTASGQLLRQGVRLRVQDQPFRLLTILLEQAGEVVSREELRERLWPADTYVDFDGSLKAALKRLRASLGDSGENSVFIETVPKRGYRFLAPVTIVGSPLAAQSTVPPATDSPRIAISETSGTAALVPAVVAAPSTRPTPIVLPVGPDAVHLPTPVKWRVLPYTTAALVLILLAALGWYRQRHGRVPTGEGSVVSAQPPVIRKSLAVLGFNNASGRAEDEWLSTAFSEMLSTELATGENLRMIPGEEVANLRISSPWPQATTLSAVTTGRIGKALGSDVLVLGSYAVTGKSDQGRLRLDVRVQDARTGEVVRELAQTCDASDLFNAASDIGAKLRDALGIPEIKDAEQAGVLASLPLDREAARFYALGLKKLREFDALAAKDLLEQATKSDPKFSLAHLMLARTWAQLGYEQKRKEETKKALELSMDLPRSERMLVEGDYYESLADHEKAESTYRALFALFPDDVDFGLQLANAQNIAGHRSQATETVVRLRSLPPPASNDPRIDLLEAGTSAPNVPARLALIQRAQKQALAQGNRLLYATARKAECAALNATDKTKDALPICEDAYNLFMAAGNRQAAADAMRFMGDIESSLSHQEQAITNYQKALKMVERLGEDENTGSVLNNMAIILTNKGDLDRAEQLYREAKSHFIRSGNKNNAASALANLGDIQYLGGHLSAAGKTYQDAIEIFSSMEDYKPGYVYYRLSDLELTRGNVQHAHQLAQQALDGIRPLQGEFAYLTEALVQMGEVLRAEGDLAGARQQFEAARETITKSGDLGLLEECQLELADLDMEEGHTAEAEFLVRPAIAELEKEQSDPATAGAYSELSQALAAEGKPNQANEAIQRAAKLILSTPDPAMRLPIAIQTARVNTAIGSEPAKKTSAVKAIQELHSIIANARRLGYYNIDCDARLALAEAEMPTDPALARSQLQALQKEAHEHGLELIASKASKTLTSAPSLSAGSSPHQP
jgi:eukaryotic-like serine/threonine-protein kinase